ncbi:MAG: 5-(carboxyamino)imidazole ribonucleotide synthase [Pantoea sp. Brub]|nr:5-(carboxyamino)imidazole ribonucleotide synthase [Pantoea sp. Brub]
MQSILVLGNGQLGRMLRQAGEQMGILIYPVGLNDDPNLLPISKSIIITEIEYWIETNLTQQIKNHPLFINQNVLPFVVDRYRQKKLLDDLCLANARWQLLSNNNQWSDIFNTLGKNIVIKKRIGGYNGKDQWHINVNKINEFKNEFDNNYIAEESINFSNEVSLIGARNTNGNIVFYPLTNNLHSKGILRISSNFPKIKKKYQKQAEYMLSSIMNKLNYIGVMTMECFITPQGLLINELAPRVHNSGHWTQNGASISQFEMHLRAILNLALPTPIVLGYSVMINLIGIERNFNWLANPLIHLHWYNKKKILGRKVGHLNLYDTNKLRLNMALNWLLPLLPHEYSLGIKWAISNLNIQ